MFQNAGGVARKVIADIAKKHGITLRTNREIAEAALAYARNIYPEIRPEDLTVTLGDMGKIMRQESECRWRKENRKCPYSCGDAGRIWQLMRFEGADGRVHYGIGFTMCGLWQNRNAGKPKPQPTPQAPKGKAFMVTREDD